MLKLLYKRNIFLSVGNSQIFGQFNILVNFDIFWNNFGILSPASVGVSVKISLLGVPLHHEGLPHVVRAEEEVPGEAVRGGES